jgi:hypothetical protein
VMELPDWAIHMFSGMTECHLHFIGVTGCNSLCFTPCLLSTFHTSTWQQPCQKCGSWRTRATAETARLSGVSYSRRWAIVVYGLDGMCMFE